MAATFGPSDDFHHRNEVADAQHLAHNGGLMDSSLLVSSNNCGGTEGTSKPTPPKVHATVQLERSASSRQPLAEFGKKRALSDQQIPDIAAVTATCLNRSWDVLSPTSFLAEVLLQVMLQRSS